jgi:hypothetical protein
MLDPRVTTEVGMDAVPDRTGLNPDEQKSLVFFISRRQRIDSLHLGSRSRLLLACSVEYKVAPRG